MTLSLLNVYKYELHTEMASFGTTKCMLNLFQFGLANNSCLLYRLNF